MCLRDSILFRHTQTGGIFLVLLCSLFVCWCSFFFPFVLCIYFSHVTRDCVFSEFFAKRILSPAMSLQIEYFQEQKPVFWCSLQNQRICLHFISIKGGFFLLRDNISQPMGTIFVNEKFLTNSNTYLRTSSNLGMNFIFYSLWWWI